MQILKFPFQLKALTLGSTFSNKHIFDCSGILPRRLVDSLLQLQRSELSVHCYPPTIVSQSLLEKYHISSSSCQLLHHLTFALSSPAFYSPQVPWLNLEESRLPPDTHCCSGCSSGCFQITAFNIQPHGSSSWKSQLPLRQKWKDHEPDRDHNLWTDRSITSSWSTNSWTRWS